MTAVQYYEHCPGVYAEYQEHNLAHQIGGCLNEQVHSDSNNRNMTRQAVFPVPRAANRKRGHRCISLAKDTLKAFRFYKTGGEKIRASKFLISRFRPSNGKR